ncbi:GDSL esterase/lipase At4g16230 [Papaver somniferum]|uniref:GDSL esterase/lipase At4g16230 n=1 Tax=Papaver somniferum TaxID=3469 RepID=UPI000E705990|nr:GDSL esterase/lipase At4g16230 [Papaver somniferum]
MGGIPFERALNGGSCRDSMNNAALLFNKKLKSLIMELNSNLVQSKFVYADVYNMFSHFLVNYQSHGAYVTYLVHQFSRSIYRDMPDISMFIGFENYTTSCCKTLPGQFRGLLPCNPISEVCSNRSKYVFWDEAHPTDAVNVIFAKKLLDGDSKDMYPMNLHQLYYENVARRRF